MTLEELFNTPAAPSPIIKIYDTDEQGNPYIYTANFGKGLVLCCAGSIESAEEKSESEIKAMIREWQIDSLNG